MRVNSRSTVCATVVAWGHAVGKVVLQKVQGVFEA